jgi:hypothetical protein
VKESSDASRLTSPRHAYPVSRFDILWLVVSQLELNEKVVSWVIWHALLEWFIWHALLEFDRYDILDAFMDLSVRGCGCGCVGVGVGVDVWLLLWLCSCVGVGMDVDVGVGVFWVSVCVNYTGFEITAPQGSHASWKPSTASVSPQGVCVCGASVSGVCACVCMCELCLPKVLGMSS